MVRPQQVRPLFKMGLFFKSTIQQLQFKPDRGDLYEFNEKGKESNPVIALSHDFDCASRLAVNLWNDTWHRP
jgi:hypothetical protein